MTNTGIHHISSLISDARQAYIFYHQMLGLKLSLKTVNQEDPSMYHLFFGNQESQVGSEFTLFEMGKDYRKNRFGTNALERTVFLVTNYDSLIFWKKRFEDHNIVHEPIMIYQDRHILYFEDFDGQKLALTYHHHIGKLAGFEHSDIPKSYRILGIAEIQIRVRELTPLLNLLEHTFEFEPKEKFEHQGFDIYPLLFSNAFQHEIHLILDKESPISVIGTAGIHHLALGVSQRDDLKVLQTTLQQEKKPNTGIINRDFIQSLYFRAPNYLMLEVATPIEHHRIVNPQQDINFDAIPLYLPEFLEGQRAEIERRLS